MADTGFFDSAFNSIGNLFSKGNIGNTTSALGNLAQGYGSYIQGIGQAQSYGASAKAEAANAALVREKTALEVTQAQREGITGQGTATAAAGANGLADSGSISDILAMNARNAQEQVSNTAKFGEMEAKVHDQASADAAAAAKAAKKGGTLGAITGAIGAVGSIASLFSDERLKDIIEVVRTRKDGIRIVTFRYKGGHAVFQGVIAQEVQKVFPNAVREIGGFLAVDYRAIGEEMKLVS